MHTLTPREARRKIARWLRGKRRAKGWSREQLARLLQRRGCAASMSSVKGWEVATCFPDAATMAVLVHELEPDTEQRYRLLAARLCITSETLRALLDAPALSSL